MIETQAPSWPTGSTAADGGEMTAMDDATAAALPSEPSLRPRPATRVMPWHRRVVQAVLYGRNVDRDRKARGAPRARASSASP